MVGFVVPVLLSVAAFCFALGLVLPIASFDRLWVFTDRPSLIGIIATLLDDGDLFIAFLVALFSVIFPAAKLVVLNVAAYAPERVHWVERVGALSKWSMADVLVVALAIFAAKTSGLAEGAAQAGIWFYAAATLLSAVVAHLLTRRAATR